MSFALVHAPEFIPLRDLVHRAIREDLSSGDVTSRIIVESNLHAHAFVLAREPTLCCAAFLANLVFEVVDPQVRIEIHSKEGEMVAQNSRMIELRGRAQSLLAGERTLLNLFGRSCGVANQTRSYVEAAKGSMRVVDTRKTMPGMRVLDRYAVRCGGGHNHRNDLGSGILIKENHILCAGGIALAIAACRAQAPHPMRIECEVRSLDELDQAIDAGADIVLLDNMSDSDLAQAVQRSAGRVLLEASGGISLSRIPKLANLGIDLVSVGALTHSSSVADLSMLIESRVESSS